MDFLQKIYFNDKPLVLTTDKEAYIHENPSSETYAIFDGATLRSFTQALQQLDRPGIRGVIIEDVSADSLQDQLHAMFRPMDAAGGLVLNEDNAVLMIYRRGKWDMAKGKLDEGENIEECAVREVKEETGLQHIALGEKICDTYHIYSQHNEQLLKRTAWYKMRGQKADKLQPQKEENILEARWVAEVDIAPIAAKSYEAIREVLRASGIPLNP
jgi:8-oxo-dGTP pyrophosphatase MutT (NUDIX family)